MEVIINEWNQFRCGGVVSRRCGWGDVGVDEVEAAKADAGLTGYVLFVRAVGCDW